MCAARPQRTYTSSSIVCACGALYLSSFAITARDAGAASVACLEGTSVQVHGIPNESLQALHGLRISPKYFKVDAVTAYMLQATLWDVTNHSL